MKNKRKHAVNTPAPTARRPVREFDRAQSRALRDIKFGNALDAIDTIMKALKMPNLSFAQKAELYLCLGNAYLLKKDAHKAREALNNALKQNGGSLSRRRVQILLGLSHAALIDAQKSWKPQDAWGLQPAAEYADAARNMANSRNYPELIEVVDRFKRKHGLS